VERVQRAVLTAHDDDRVVAEIDDEE